MWRSLGLLFLSIVLPAMAQRNCSSGYAWADLQTYSIVNFDTETVPDRNEYRAVVFLPNSTDGLDGQSLLRDLYCSVTPKIPLGRLALSSADNSSSWVTGVGLAAQVIVRGQNALDYSGPPANELAPLIVGQVRNGTAQVTQAIRAIVFQKDPAGVAPTPSTAFVTGGLMAVMIVPIVLFNISFLIYKMSGSRQKAGSYVLTSSNHIVNSTLMSSNNSFQGNTTLSNSNVQTFNNSNAQTLNNNNNNMHQSFNNNSTVKKQSSHAPPSETVRTRRGSSTAASVRSAAGIISQKTKIFLQSSEIRLAIGTFLTLVLTLMPIILKSSGVKLNSVLTAAKACEALHYSTSQANKCAIESTQAIMWYLTELQLHWIIFFAAIVAQVLSFIQFLLNRNLAPLKWIPLWCSVGINSIIVVSSHMWMGFENRDVVSFEVAMHLTGSIVQGVIAFVACIFLLLPKINRIKLTNDKSFKFAIWSAFVSVGVSLILTAVVVLLVRMTMANQVVLTSSVINLYILPLVLFASCLIMSFYYEQRQSNPEYHTAFYWVPFIAQQVMPLISNANGTNLTANYVHSCTVSMIVNLGIYLFEVASASCVNFNDTTSMQQYIDIVSENTMSSNVVATLNSKIYNSLPSSLRETIHLTGGHVAHHAVHRNQSNASLMNLSTSRLNEHVSDSTNHLAMHRQQSSNALAAESVQNNLPRVAMTKQENQTVIPTSAQPNGEVVVVTRQLRVLRRIANQLVSPVLWVSLINLLFAFVFLGPWDNAPFSYCTVKEQNGINSCILTIYSGIRGVFDHALLEVLSSLLCFSVFVLAMMHYATYRQDIVVFYAYAFLGSAMGDVIHNLVASRYLIGADIANYVTYSWSVSRLYNSCVLIFGSANVLLVEWLQRRRSIVKANQIQKQKSGGDVEVEHRISNGYLLLWGLLLLAPLLYVQIYCMLTPALPKSVYLGQVIVRPFDFVPFILYICFFCLSVFVYLSNDNTLPGMRRGLLLSTLPNIAAQAHMSFGSSASYDADFNAAHFLKLVAYGIAAMGLAEDVFSAVLTKIQLQQKLLKVSHRVNTSVNQLINNTTRQGQA